MKRRKFFKMCIEETEKTADLLPIISNQSYSRETEAIHGILNANGYNIHDFQLVGLIAAIYRVGIAVGIRAERRRRKGRAT